MRRRDQPFRTIRSEGALLTSDLLQRIAQGDKDLGGLRAEDYHVTDVPLSEAIVRSWNRLVGAWTSFRDAEQALPEDDLATTVTRERWLLVLFDEFSYGRLQTQKAIAIEGKEYPVSHVWETVPIHLVGSRVPLDRRSRGVAGAAGQSPHGLVQELLNRSEERLWGFVSNGLVLRLLRDSSSLTRQAYLEFDLQEMMESEAYSDFVLLWLTCHVSRVEGERSHECWLERWSQEAEKQGTRALDSLRSGVERAIAALGAGFLAHPGNDAIRAALRNGELQAHDYYRELLRLVYRLLFLFASEDRGLLHDPRAGERERERYARFYSTERLRRLAERRRGTRHADLYEALKLVMRALGDDEGEPALGLPALGSFLWSEAALPNLDDARLANGDLLEAIRALSFVEERRVLRAVDYRNMGAEELGSVYESLLELHPELNADAGTFSLTTAAGNERKTTGSYYTPTSLISVLLDSALDPVLEEAAAKGEEGILDLKVVDPACGSGHFLVAAAHRIAKRLASARTGDDEPSPEATRAALRDVVSRCLYGVDVNPMAVELCKVSLWMEALDPGRPLSFLDAHVKCGNSLLGTVAALMSDGIPDEAFKALDGDDKEIANALRRQNRLERQGQLSLDDAAVDLISEIKDQAAELESAGDATPDELHAKEQLFHDLIGSDSYERAKLAADAWCAAFLQRKNTDAPRITTGVIRRIASGEGSVLHEVLDEIRRIADQYAFFQWEIEYPQVFGRERGGFDVVLGNPPWEQVQFDPRELLARAPSLAEAKNLRARRQALAELADADPTTHAAILEAERQTGATQHFIHASGRFPLSSRGRLNTAPLFTEFGGALVRSHGRAGLIVPSGLAFDSFTQFLFQDLVNSGSLESLWDFENHLGIFPSVAPTQKFCLLTLAKDSQRRGADFVFFAHRVDDLHDADRHFTLTGEEMRLLNPKTLTCPIFRSQRDAELTKAIYRRLPVVGRPTVESADVWGVSGHLMFMMDNVGQLGRSAEDLGASGAALVGNYFHLDGEVLSPVYEAKLIQQFDHRFNTFEGVPAESRFGVRAGANRFDQKENPLALPIPRYWIPASAVEARLADKSPFDWLIVWRDTTSVATNRRTVVVAVIPRVACGDTLPVLLPGEQSAAMLMSLVACLNSFACDYVARQKVGGRHLRFHVFEQLAVPPPSSLAAQAEWDRSTPVVDWFAPRVLELTYTALDLKPLANDLGYGGNPFWWNAERRAVVCAELDAACFLLYGCSRDEIEYVLDTFPIARRQDEQAFGEFRTKRLILEVYDELSEAIASGRSYQTRLDPPPADPRVAHAPLHENASMVRDEPMPSVATSGDPG